MLTGVRVLHALLSFPALPATPVAAGALRRARWRNRLEALAIVAALLGLMILVGGGLFGAAGLGMAAAAGIALVVLVPAAPTRWILRMKGARPLARWEVPDLQRAVAALANRAGLSDPPRLHVQPSPMANAYAVGTPGDGAVVVTAGILRALPPRELLGVLAHELSHLKHRDVAVMRLAGTVGSVTAAIGRFGILLTILALPLALLGVAVVPWTLVPLLWLAPVAANLLLLALSRRRELAADLGAVDLTGDPGGLARALARLERGRSSWLGRLVGLEPGADPTPEWLRTHPTTGTRIARLRALGATTA